MAFSGEGSMALADNTSKNRRNAGSPKTILDHFQEVGAAMRRSSDVDKCQLHSKSRPYRETIL
jgi:hypothetical protein